MSFYSENKSYILVDVRRSGTNGGGGCKPGVRNSRDKRPWRPTAGKKRRGLRREIGGGYGAYVEDLRGRSNSEPGFSDLAGIFVVLPLPFLLPMTVQMRQGSGHFRGLMSRAAEKGWGGDGLDTPMKEEESLWCGEYRGGRFWVRQPRLDWVEVQAEEAGYEKAHSGAE